MVKLCVMCSAQWRLAEARDTAARCGLEIVTEPSGEDEFILHFGDHDVRLRSPGKKQNDIVIDFCAGSAAHRRKFGGGKGQLIAKAAGIKGRIKPHVYDLTAGLGGDAFVLACLGCRVTMVERNPVVYALLADGLARAREFAQAHDNELGEILERLQLLNAADSIAWLQSSSAKPEVIYLDPMFPERKKSASVKKEMQAFHGLVGDDDDAGELLTLALKKAEYRVVVKRPRIAPSIDERPPSLKLEGKSSRYDIYALKSLSRLEV